MAKYYILCAALTAGFVAIPPAFALIKTLSFVAGILPTIN
jgi:hypothetical protein